MKHKFIFGDKEACWSDIEAVYELDKQQTLRLAPRVSDCHMHPNGFMKMRVKYAVQVLSHTTAAMLNAHISWGNLTGKAMGTVEFINRFDNLFDCVNSSGIRKDKPYQSSLSETSEAK